MKRFGPFTFTLLICSTLFSQTRESETELGRVYASDVRPNDFRLQELKDLNGYFPMSVPSSRAAWEKRADDLRRRILVSCGLWPMPARPPIQPTIHGKVDRDDYTVERVYFESHPGFYVTGSLYRPKGKAGPHPVVLSPYGHYSNGRFHDHGDKEILRQIKWGAERFKVGGRHPLQARCVHLARMGCVVFHYDMIGYADSQQLNYELAHRHSAPRPVMENRERWGLFTAQAEMRLQNIFGLQTFNSLRAVDFVVQLPDVDATRIAVTGSSGGGTQTMMLAALEPRITVSFPAVMVSTAMQGGCTCENTTCLRVGTGNIEFAALFAPKPQGISYANDWTKELLTKGLPELKALYKLYGAESLVHADRKLGRSIDLTYFDHNYNHVCRDMMYDWMKEHLKLDVPEDFLEEDYQPLSTDELTVWNDEHPRPPSGDAFETKFLKELSDTSDAALHELAKSPRDFRQVVRPALETILGTSYERIGVVARDEDPVKQDEGDYWLFKDKIRSDGTELPTIFLHPKNWNQNVVIWASGDGKASLWKDGELRPAARKLLENGYSIAAADLLMQGEFVSEPLRQTRKVSNNRDFAGYTFGYNLSLVGNRVRDLLTLLKLIEGDDHGTEGIHMIGADGAEPLVALCGAFAGQHINKLAIVDGDFRFANVPSWRDPYFLPGAIKYGDLPAMIALGNAKQVCVGSTDAKKLAAEMEPYRKLNPMPHIAEADKSLSTAVDWLLDN